MSVFEVKGVKNYNNQSLLDFNNVIKSINTSAVLAHSEILSNFGTRVTGYPGSYLAADYIRNVFNSYGLNVSTHEYSVVVPIDHGASISFPSLENKSIVAYNLWPNYIQTSFTPYQGLDGKLIYAKSGSLSDFNGLDVKDSIVLMNFNSNDNWINAMKLGAKAVIFIEPNSTDWFEANAKLSRVPVYFPRLYVSAKDGDVLINYSKTGIIANVKSEMRFENITAENIIGIIEGSEYPNEIIIVAAHYDTWSIVPSFAPGADEATSVATLFEIAKFFSINKPKRTIWLVALSGHWEALAGSREFVEKYYYHEEATSGLRKILVFLGLDFSTDSKKSALIYEGGFYGYNPGGDSVRNKISRIIGSRVFNTYLPLMNSQLNRTYDNIFVDGIIGGYSIPNDNFMLDSEPVIASRGIGLTIRTSECFRKDWGTPLSNKEKINFENLKPQVEIAGSLAYALANDDGLSVDWNEVSPVRTFWLGPGSLYSELIGFLSVQGKVLMYNQSRGWYDIVPNLLVVVTRYPYSENPFMNIITFADSKGEYRVNGLLYGPGIEPSSQSREVVSPANLKPYGPRSGRYYVEAYGINSTTGQIEYAPDFGRNGIPVISFGIDATEHPSNSLTVVFRASSIAVFDLLQIDIVSSLAIMDPRYVNRAWRVGVSYNFYIYDVYTQSEFVSYSHVILPQERVSLFFIPQNSRYFIIYKYGELQTICGLLINYDPQNPNEIGYFSDENNLLSFIYPIDFYNVALSRYRVLNESSIRDLNVERSLSETLNYINKYNECLENKIYDRAFEYELVAWVLVAKAYKQTMDLINDTSYTGTVLFSLLIPFSLISERLFSKASGLRRLFNTIAMFVVPLILLYFLHPGFRLAANVYIGTIGLVLMAFFIFIFIIMFNQLAQLAKKIQEKIIGYHEFERGRIATISFSIPLAIENLKKRKLRTSLICITIVLITFSLISLTSISIFGETYISRTPRSAAYDGILLKRFNSEPENFLSPTILDYTRGVIGQGVKIIPRIWYYPQVVRKHVSVNIYSSTAQFEVSAIVGLTQYEQLVNPALSLDIIGRWFEEGDFEVCILSRALSQFLNVDVGDNLNMEGFNLVVVGIIKDEIINSFLDLDQRRILPLDPDAMTATSFQSLVNLQVDLSAQSVLFVPYDLALKIGGALSSVALKFDDQNRTLDIANNLARNLNVFVYAGINGTIHQTSRTVTSRSMGLQFFLIPLILGSAVILNSMLGAINERLKEIRTFNSLGLSPTGITLFFFAEAITYSIIGAVIGYLIGIFVNLILSKQSTNMILNYSSTSSLMAVAFAIAAPLLSTVYPAYISSKIMTPLKERKWKIVNKPKGNSWEVPLPFSVSEISEARNILIFMSEYLQAHTVETPAGFIVQNIISKDASRLVFLISLPPYELGVLQEAILFVISEKEDKHNFILNLNLLRGDRDMWIRSNYKFIDAIRKQLLIWRSLKPHERKRYETF
ncbi:MAG: M28 family peptidase [Candidatus Bathyarchaeia archaeon]